MRHRHTGWSDSTSRHRSKPRAGFTWLELIFVFCAIGLVIALCLPAVRRVREAAPRTQCKNNLKQIALALYNYEDAYQTLPPAYTVDADGRPLHSWRTLLLPYLDQQSLYESIDLSKPWDDPANAVLLDWMPQCFRCPSADVPPDVTTYVAVVGPNACFLPTDSREFAAITDGVHETLMVVEVSPDAAIPWMAPQDGGAEFVANFGADTRMPHEGGFQAAFADGSVRFIPTTLPAATRSAMIIIDGNEEWLSATVGRTDHPLYSTSSAQSAFPFPSRRRQWAMTAATFWRSIPGQKSPDSSPNSTPPDRCCTGPNRLQSGITKPPEKLPVFRSFLHSSRPEERTVTDTLSCRPSAGC